MKEKLIKLLDEMEEKNRQDYEQYIELRKQYQENFINKNKIRSIIRDKIQRLDLMDTSDAEVLLAQRELEDLVKQIDTIEKE